MALMTMLTEVDNVELRLMGACAGAAAASCLIGFPAAWAGRRLRILDRPGHRSSHSTPTPRVGGVAILLGALIGFMLFAKLTLAFLVAAGVGAVVVGTSFVDDVISMPSLARLAVHFVVAGLTIGLIGLGLRDPGLPFLLLPLPGWLGLAMAVVFTVGFVNFFNFMDGINGIASLQGLIGGLSLSLLLLWGEMGNSVLAAAALAGACMGFLPHNFPRARMFMGDVGSTAIGFTLAMLTLLGGKHSGMPWVAFVLPLGVFLYDATFTLFKRALRRENVLQAHREHHYQLLIRCGWSHTTVSLVQAGLMVLCSAGGLIYARVGPAGQLAVLIGLLAVLGSYSVWVHRYFRTHRCDSPAPMAEPAALPVAPEGHA